MGNRPFLWINEKIMIRRQIINRVLEYTGYVISIFSLSFFISYVSEGAFDFSLVFFLLSLGLVFLMRTPHKEISWWKAFLLGLMLFVLRGSVVWALNTFPLEDYRLVILTLQMPLDGFVLPFVIDYLTKIFFVGSILVFLSLRFFKSYIGMLSINGVLFLFLCMTLWNVLTLYLQLPLKEYWNFIRNGDSDVVLQESPFWKENYSDIDSLKINAGERNLILIIMESMENWPKNLTPEIEQMASDNISFSDTGVFGGGVDIAGSKNTYCSTVSKTTGVPMLRNNKHLGKDLIQVKGLYDVLRNFGYKNVFLQGTDADFSGLKSFMINHGIDSLYDMDNLKDDWDMNAIFRNFRNFSAGITDKRLYDISKNILDTLSRDKFSLTIATIETHFPYGFYDEKNCFEKPESSSDEAKFKATLQCASREVHEFIEWAKKQPFFENTEIVIVGDHLFMGHFFEKNRDRRWVNIFLNSMATPITRKRQFTSIDIAPTILEGMGFQIEGHKMGLGTSLFSDSLTLLEKMGWTKLNSELKKLGSSIEYNRLNWEENK